MGKTDKTTDTQVYRRTDVQKTKRLIEGQTDRQTGRQADSQTYSLTNRQTQKDRETDRGTDRQVCGQTDIQKTERLIEG